MRRAIVSFSCDEQGDWIAHLACGHRQHVRHKPPLVTRPWVLTAGGRDAMLGAELDCPPCARSESPS